MRKGNGGSGSGAVAFRLAAGTVGLALSRRPWPECFRVGPLAAFGDRRERLEPAAMAWAAVGLVVRRWFERLDGGLAMASHFNWRGPTGQCCPEGKVPRLPIKVLTNWRRLEFLHQHRAQTVDTLGTACYTV